MPPRPTDSDSDDEADKLKMKQMRESIAQDQLAAQHQKQQQASTALNNNNAAAASSASIIAASSTAATAVPSTASSTQLTTFSTSATSAASTNPFYSLLVPAIPPFLLKPTPVISPELQSHPLRCAFLAHVREHMMKERSKLDRKRVLAQQNKLQSNRTASDDSAPAAPNTNTHRGPLSSFEQSMLKNLLAMVQRNLEIDDNVWMDESDEQRQEREEAMKLLRAFVVMKQYPPGSFLNDDNDLVMNLAATAASSSSATSKSVATDSEAKKAKKEKKRKERDEKAAASGKPIESEEERRIRKAKKKEKRKLEAQQENGGDAQANKKTKGENSSAD